MKLGQAMYEQQQVAGRACAAGADGATPRLPPPADGEEVVDAEFSEVDDEQKG